MYSVSWQQYRWYIVDAGNFNWNNVTFPFSPSREGYHGLVFGDHFSPASPNGNMHLSSRQGWKVYGTSGLQSALSILIFSFWVLRHFSLRMDRHIANTLALAKVLRSHPGVERVIYPGLPDNPYHELAKKYLPKGPGGVLSFILRDNKGLAFRLVEHLNGKPPGKCRRYQDTYHTAFRHNTFTAKP